MSIIRTVTPSDYGRIAALRHDAYARSTEFDLIDATEIVRVADDPGTVLAAFDGVEPVATMHGLIVSYLSDAEEILTCRIGPEAKFPALILSRAATAMTHKGVGLNSVLRYYFLKAVVDRVECVLGAVYEGAPRTHIMDTLGYAFHQKSTWDKDKKMRGKHYLSILDADQLDQAVAKLEDMMSLKLQEFPWYGPILQLKSK